MARSAAIRKIPIHEPATQGEPIETTLLELVQTIGELTQDDREVVATVIEMLRAEGYSTLPLPSQGTPVDARFQCGILSFKHAAEAAGLGQLQTFLESGFDTFAALSRQRGSVAVFMDLIRTREMALIDRWFDADAVACETELCGLLGQVR